MGGLFSRTVVVDLTTQYSSELKQIETQLASLQTRKQAQLSLKRRLTRGLILYGTLIWLLLLLLCLYVVEFPNRNHVVAKCLKIGPIIGWPLVLFLLKSSIDSYYNIKWRKADAQIVKLEKSKETKLEDLMAKTNFKATQQLISQFSEKKKPQVKPGASPEKQTAGGGPQQQMQQGGRPGMHGGPMVTPGRGAQTMPAPAFKQAQQMQQHLQQQQFLQQQQGGPHQQQRPSGPAAAPASSEPLASRSSLDKVLDFLLNEGPNNKYALICTSCQGHNGLVREQELGKIRFRCAMCGASNGPPLPPQLQGQQPPGGQIPMTPANHGRNASADASSSAFTPAASPSGAPLTPFAPLSARRSEVSEALGDAGAADGDGEEEEEVPAARGRASAHSRSNSSRMGGEAPTERREVEANDDEEEEEGEEKKGKMRNRKAGN